jgi:RNA polymerase sigma-70 factor (ECF subfamily)
VTRPGGPSDEELAQALDAARRHEEAGFRLLYRWMNPRLLRYFQGRVGAMAEDLTAEVWADAARALDGFGGDWTAFRAMLFTIARRRLVDLRRRQGRSIACMPIDDAPDRPSTEDTETDTLSAIATRDAVRSIVDGLPFEQAEILLLRVLGDLDVREVARLLGKSPGAVRVAQHRALQRLRRALESAEAVTQ